MLVLNMSQEVPYTADSLTALKYIVYDKKIATGREFLQAILDDWKGHEPLRQRVLHEVPHYGNNDPYADEEMKYVMDLYYNITRAFSTCRCTTYKCGTFGASDHVVQGEITWATPDGRRTGEPIADACSPAQGRDTNGPTAVLTSATKFDQSRLMQNQSAVRQDLAMIAHSLCLENIPSESRHMKSIAEGQVE